MLKTTTNSTNGYQSSIEELKEFQYSFILKGDSKVYISNIVKNKYLVTFNMPNGEKIETEVEHGNNAKIPDIKKGVFDILIFDGNYENVTDNISVTIKKINLIIPIAGGAGLISLIIILAVVRKKKLKARIKKQQDLMYQQMQSQMTGVGRNVYPSGNMQNIPNGQTQQNSYNQQNSYLNSNNMYGQNANVNFNPSGDYQYNQNQFTNTQYDQIVNNLQNQYNQNPYSNMNQPYGNSQSGLNQTQYNNSVTNDSNKIDNEVKGQYRPSNDNEN